MIGVIVPNALGYNPGGGVRITLTINRIMWGSIMQLGDERALCGCPCVLSQSLSHALLERLLIDESGKSILPSDQRGNICSGS